MSVDKNREAFEAWFLSERKWLPANASERMFLQKEGNYENWAVNDAWKAWQAALASPEVQALRDALEQYADSNNWEKDEFGWRRIWREPGSTTPESYDGYELALSALAQKQGGSDGDH